MRFPGGDRFRLLRSPVCLPRRPDVLPPEMATTKQPTGPERSVVLTHVHQSDAARVPDQPTLPFPGNGEWDERRGQHVCGDRRRTRAGWVPAQANPRTAPADADRPGEGDRRLKTRCRGSRPDSGGPTLELLLALSLRPTGYRSTTSSAPPRSATRGSGSSPAWSRAGR